MCILLEDNGIIYIGLACYLLLQQIFLGAGKSLNEQYEFVSALLTQISWTNHLTIMSKAKTVEEKHFYLTLCIKESYSDRSDKRIER